MNKLATGLGKILEALIAGAFLVILLLVIIQVVLRYVFNSSITGANEIIIVLFVYTTAIGGALAAGRREHIALTFAIDLLSPSARVFVDRLGLLLVAFINAVMVWYSLSWIQVTGDYLMPSTGLSRWVALISVPLGCGIAALYCTASAFAPQFDKAQEGAKG